MATINKIPMCLQKLAIFKINSKFRALALFYICYLPLSEEAQLMVCELRKHAYASFLKQENNVDI